MTAHQARVPEPYPVPTVIGCTTVQMQTPGQPPKWWLAWEVFTPAGRFVFFTGHATTKQVREDLGKHLDRWPGELAVPAGADVEAVRRQILNGPP